MACAGRVRFGSRRWILAPIAVSVLGAAIAAAAHRVLPAARRTTDGLFVGGRVPPSDQELSVWLAQRRAALAARRVTLVHGMEAIETTLGELGVGIDIARTVEATLLPGRQGTLRERWETILRARKGQIDVPLSYSVDMAKSEAAFRLTAERVHREPRDARLDLTAHERVPEVAGEDLDLEASIASVMKGVEAGRDVFALATRPIPARVTLESVAAVDVTRVVASYETRFQLWGEGAGRAVNIAVASRSLDGTVLMPGQSLSFNGIVGARTRAQGYTDAPEIIGDELQSGVGGGVCQVASTLYAAALIAALEVEQRWAHARPSSYTKLGLDATVSYPSKDLRFKNTLPFPVILHVFLPNSTTLRAEVLGGEPIARVEYLFGISKTEPFQRRIVHKQWLAHGTALRHQKGIKGYSVYSLVRTSFGDGRKAERGYSSQYPPTPEVFWVSQDYDESKLPDLPEGAKGIENRANAASDTTTPSG